MIKRLFQAFLITTGLFTALILFAAFLVPELKEKEIGDDDDDDIDEIFDPDIAKMFDEDKKDIVPEKKESKSFLSERFEKIKEKKYDGYTFIEDDED